MKAILGFLDNLSYPGYYDDSKKDQEREIISRFGSHKKGNPAVYYRGPFENVSAFPKGSYLFKILRNSDKETKPLVLESLGLDESLVLKPGSGHGREIELGIIAKENPTNEHSQGIGYWEMNVREFGSCVSAFRRQKEKYGERFTKPYFMILDENFRKMFPVIPEEDYMSLWTDCKPINIKKTKTLQDRIGVKPINQIITSPRERIEFMY